MNIDEMKLTTEEKITLKLKLYEYCRNATRAKMAEAIADTALKVLEFGRDATCHLTDRVHIHTEVPGSPNDERFFIKVIEAGDYSTASRIEFRFNDVGYSPTVQLMDAGRISRGDMKNMVCGIVYGSVMTALAEGALDGYKGRVTELKKEIQTIDDKIYELESELARLIPGSE